MDEALEEDEFSTKKNTDRLIKINETLQSKCLMSKYSLLDLSSIDSIAKIKEDSLNVKDDTLAIIDLL